MLTDPISMTGNGAAESFAREEVSGRKTVYNVLARASGNECKLQFNHQKAGSGINIRTRSQMRMEDNITLSDGVTPGLNSVQLVCDFADKTANDTAKLELLAKLVNYLDVPANAQALIDGQS